MKFICKMIKKVISFVFNKPNGRENIFQFIVRHFLLTDSKGVPSYTVTILVFVMTIIGFITFNEIKMANSYIYTYTQTGEILTKVKKGFSSEFYYLIFILAPMIVWFFKQRGDKTANIEDVENKSDDTSIVSTVVDAAKSMISKFTGK